MNTRKIESEELIDILDFLSGYCSSKDVDQIKETILDMNLAYNHHLKEESK